MPLDEKAWNNAVGSVHRKAFGQFFTHPLIARFMVDWVLQKNRKVVHDPAFGLGAFFDAASERQDVSFTGSELDRKILDYWRHHAHDTCAEIWQEDYLQTWGRRYPNIVCNPPYMRFQHFRNRSQVLANFKKYAGLSLSGYTNIASAFLMKSLLELEADGRLAYIMPLEFLNAGYGVAVKRALTKDGHLAAIIRLACEREAFPDATTSAGVILYDNAAVHDEVQFFNVQSLNELSELLTSAPVSSIASHRLEPNTKWLTFFRKRVHVTHQEKMLPISHYGKFKRGIATGANEFFALRSSQANDIGIPMPDMRQCVMRNAHIQAPILTNAAFMSLIRRDMPTCLFSPSENPSRAAMRYIGQGETKGFHKRFLTSRRKPWYKTEERKPSPLWMGVFSRNGYKVIRNLTDALNLTCFHGFEPNLFGEAYIDRIFLYLMSSAGRQIVSLNVREYGDTLHKFEPNDLNNALMPVPDWLDGIKDAEVERSMSHIDATGLLPNDMNARFAELAA